MTYEILLGQFFGTAVCLLGAWFLFVSVGWYVDYVNMERRRLRRLY